MKSIAKTSIALAAALSMGASFADVTFDANIETNTVKPTSKSVSNGGRIELNANALMGKSGDNFVSAKGTIEIGLGGDNPAVADAWIQFGNASADLKLGRFEAVDLFPLGKDVVVESAGAASGYRAATLRGRFKQGQMHTALGLNLGSGLRAEVGVVTKKDGSGAAYGFRPTVTYSAGALTLRAGMESIKTEGSTAASQTGLGLSTGYAVNDSTTINVNFAKNSKAKTQSLGANVVFGAAGLGLVQDKADGKSQNTVYAAYSLPLFGVKGATVTPAFSRSTGTDVSGVTAVGVRLNYAF